MFRHLYGERLLHFIVLLAALALVVYTISVLGIQSLYNPNVWWQSIVVWFGVAVIAHDLVLFPLYALADRLLSRTPRLSRDGVRSDSRRISLTNYVRMPTLATGLVFLMFSPGIIQQGAQTYVNATGLTQEPYLHRWLILTAVFYLLSALWYVVRSVMALRRR